MGTPHSALRTPQFRRRAGRALAALCALYAAGCPPPQPDGPGAPPSGETRPAWLADYLAAMALPDDLSPADLDRTAQALQASDAGEHARALTLWTDLVTRHPNFGEAWFWLGQIALAEGDTAREADCYRRCLQRLPMHVEARLGLAAAAYELDRREEAIAQYRTLLSHYAPAQPRALRNLAVLLMDRGLAERGRDDLEEALGLWDRFLAGAVAEEQRFGALERARVLADLAVLFDDPGARDRARAAWRELAARFADEEFQAEAARQQARLDAPAPPE